AGNAAIRQALRSKLAHSCDDALFAVVCDQTPFGAEVRTIRCMAANPLATQPFHVHRTAGPLPDHGAFQLGENVRHLRHWSPVRTVQAEDFLYSNHLNPLLVEVGDNSGRIGYGAE